MNGDLHGEREQLRILQEVLEDCHQFYLDAAAASSGDAGWLHKVKASCYATMLAEIALWRQAHRDWGVAGSLDPWPPSSRTAAADARDSDTYSAMVERINRIHDSLFPAIPALDGAADEDPTPVRNSVADAGRGQRSIPRRRRRRI